MIFLGCVYHPTIQHTILIILHELIVLHRGLIFSKRKAPKWGHFLIQADRLFKAHTSSIF